MTESNKQKHKRWRIQFRNQCLERDGHQCKMCGDFDSKLDVHHITDRKDMPNGGYASTNGITLCDKANGCHAKAEVWNQTHGVKWHPGFHPKDLYAKIGSDYEQAVIDSNNLR